MTDREREILEQAHAKIQTKEYREARHILLKIPSNPTAAKWLIKIEKIIAQETPPPAARPTIVTSKPLPDLNTPLPRPKRSSSRTSLPVLLFAIAAGVGVLVVVIGLTTNVLSDYLIPPQSYQDEYISLTQGWGWQQQSIGSHRYCYFIQSLQCLYYITASPDIGILFTQVTLTDGLTAYDFGESVWQSNLSDESYTERDLYFDELFIADQPAVAYMYYQARNEENAGEIYMADIYLTDGDDGYLVNLSARSPCNLAGRIEDVNNLLSTLRITSTAAPVEDDGFTSTSQVALRVSACNPGDA